MLEVDLLVAKRAEFAGARAHVESTLRAHAAAGFTLFGIAFGKPRSTWQLPFLREDGPLRRRGTIG